MQKGLNVDHQPAGGLRGMIGQLRGVAEGLLASRWGSHSRDPAHEHGETNPTGLVELVATHDEGSLNLYGSWDQSQRRRSKPTGRQRLLREPDDSDLGQKQDEKDRSVVEILSQAMSARSMPGLRPQSGIMTAERTPNETPGPPIADIRCFKQLEQHDHFRRRPKHSKAASVFGRDAVAKMDPTQKALSDQSRAHDDHKSNHITLMQPSEQCDEGMRDIAPLIALACDRVAAMSTAKHAAAARRDVTHESKHSLACCSNAFFCTASLGLERNSPRLLHSKHQATISASLGSFDTPQPLSRPKSSGSSSQANHRRLLTRADDISSSHFDPEGSTQDGFASIQTIIERVANSIKYGGSGRMVVVAALVYLGRLSGMCDCERYKISKTNHIRTVTVCLLAATKMYVEADQSPRRVNSAFSKASGIALNELSRLEVTLLFLLDFQLIVDEPEARRWCQWLHDVALRKGMEAPLHLFFQTSPSELGNSPFTPGASVTQTPPTVLDLEGNISPILYATSLPPTVAQARNANGAKAQQSPTPAGIPRSFTLEGSALALGSAAAVPVAMASPLALQPLSHPKCVSSPAVNRNLDPVIGRLFSCIFQTRSDGTCSPVSTTGSDPPSPPHEDRSPMRSFLCHGESPSHHQEHNQDVLRDFSRLVRHATAVVTNEDLVDHMQPPNHPPQLTMSPPDVGRARWIRRAPSPEEPDSLQLSGAARFLKQTRRVTSESRPTLDDDDRWEALTQRRQCLSPI